jgi:hypothetical protein
VIAENAAAGKPPLGVRVLRAHSLKTRPASNGARIGPRHNVAFYAQRSAAGTVEPQSASGRITDTMPVPARAAPLAPQSWIDLVPKSLTCRIATNALLATIKI